MCVIGMGSFNGYLSFIVGDGTFYLFSCLQVLILLLEEWPALGHDLPMLFRCHNVQCACNIKNLHYS